MAEGKSLKEQDLNPGMKAEPATILPLDPSMPLVSFMPWVYQLDQGTQMSLPKF